MHRSKHITYGRRLRELRPGSDAGSTHMPNLTDELSTAKERRLNQFGAAVLDYCGKSVIKVRQSLFNFCRT